MIGGKSRGWGENGSRGFPILPTVPKKGRCPTSHSSFLYFSSFYEVGIARRSMIVMELVGGDAV